MDKINIVMTGGTSGFGAVAARQLIHASNTKVILGYRSRKIEGAEHIPLDLSTLGKVQTFADQVIQKIDNKGIDVLICNAGTNFQTIDHRTSDGFEATFAINHLSHYLLVRLLMPHFSQHAKIILTTSGTHNPAEKSRAAAPEHANVDWLAHPEKDQTLDLKPAINAQRAYASSKLCNLLTARYINVLPQAKSNHWQGVAYDPGPVPGTGLAQNLSLPLRILWQVLTIPALRKRMLPKSNSIKQAGKALADLALRKIELPDGKTYAALRKGEMTFPNPSDLALDNEIMKKVWVDSERLLGL